MAKLISPHKITIEELFVYFKEDFKLELSDDSKQSVVNARKYLDDKMTDPNAIIYGVNTGFGSLCDVSISSEQTSELQYNLIVSHAAGQGGYVPTEIARLILLLKIKNLAFGYSGVSLTLLERLMFFYNNKITPVIYQLGSLGASGDLVPLAHMSLPLLGQGEVWYEGQKQSSKDILEQFNIESLQLQSKEGLALINGTQFSLAYSVYSCYHASNLLRWANTIAALSIEAFVCCLDPFDPDIHRIRQHKGQIETAKNILETLDGSEVLSAHKHSIQDPYSFRCVPQVHGASADAINYVKSSVQSEINAVTDNPNIFVKEDKILSGGNFHAQPLALPLDFLSIAISELASISERRTYKLINGERGLPNYLTENSGLNSGLMIAQYTAASIVSQNKQLCSPASVDSIVSSKGQEDHVSMAANAATKTYRVIQNVYSVLAIEMMSAVQALEFRRPKKSSPKLEAIINEYRKRVDKLTIDRVLHKDIDVTVEFLKTYEN